MSLRPLPILDSVWLSILRRNRLFNAVIFAVGLLLLMVVWLTPMPFVAMRLPKELVRSGATLVILGATYLLLFWRRDARVPFWIWLAVSAAAASVAMIVSVHYLDRFPQLNAIDELHNWSVQWTFANTGLLGEAMYRQMIPIPQPIYDTPHYVLGFLLRFIGDGFWSARFARLLMACLALPFIYLSGKRMYGPRTGLFAVVFALILLAPTAYVRPDVFVGVMLSVAIYVYLRAQTTRRPWMHYLTGLCVALGGEGHPLAYRFGVAFAVIYIARWFYEMWHTRRLFIDGRVVVLALGGFTGMLIYVSIHILPNVEQGLHFALNNGPGSITDHGQAALFSIDQQFNIWVSASPLELLLLFLGIVLAFRANTQADRLLLTLIIVAEGLLLASYGYYREFYQVHFLPVFALLIGRFVATITEGRGTRLPAGRLAGLTLAVMIVTVSLANLYLDAQSAASDPMRDEFTAIGRQLKANLPDHVTIVGNEDYFLEMRSLNYYGIETITTDHWFLVNYSGYKLWQVTNPDIFILSGAVLDTPKYTDMASIYSYMNDNNFTLVHCYTQTGMINARVYYRHVPPNWDGNTQCTPAVQSSPG